jgi:hypothetical protein
VADEGGKKTDSSGNFFSLEGKDGETTDAKNIAGKLASWEVGKLASWQVGKLASW